MEDKQTIILFSQKKCKIPVKIKEDMKKKINKKKPYKILLKK